LKIYISQGNAAAQLMFMVYLVTTLLKNFHRMCRWKNVKIGQYLVRIKTKGSGLLSLAIVYVTDDRLTADRRMQHCSISATLNTVGW